MNICGIIAEYNPFHNGHAYMIKQIKELYKDTAVIAIMSGSFTQRGEVAILDKYSRAKVAVQKGCDIVFELPFAYTARSGEFFAKGAINTLNRLNVLDMLAFGCETDDMALLKNISDILDSLEAQIKIHKAIKEGASYAKALSSALSKSVDENTIKKPNSILAVEYLRALKKCSSKIIPILIKRQGADHGDEVIDGSIASASAIRAEFKKTDPNFNILKNVLPKETLCDMQKKLYFHENLFKPLLAKIYTDNFGDLQKICGVNEGLENRIIKVAKISENFEALVQNISAKRYSKARIRRILSNILMDFTWDMAKTIDENPPYARLLAFNPVGAKILREIKQKSQIPVIEKTSKFISETMLYRDFKSLSPLQTSLALDIRAANIMTLASNVWEGINKDYINSPVYVV